jgi:superfamily II DNA/RNA helicase
VFGKSSPHPIRPLLTTDSYTIIDEADELLDVGWEADMAKIMSGGGKKERSHLSDQTLLTIPRYQ